MRYLYSARGTKASLRCVRATIFLPMALELNQLIAELQESSSESHLNGLGSRVYVCESCHTGM